VIIQDESLWRDQASCARPGVDPEWWFPVSSVSETAESLAARAICDRVCPVTAECEALALAIGATAGIWAGRLADELRDPDFQPATLTLLRKCRKGLHDLTAENTYRDGRGRRMCRACAAARAVARKQKASVLAGQQ